MPSTPRNPTPHKSAPDSRRSQNPLPDGPQWTVNWRAVAWYLPLMLLILWIWQEMFYSMTVKTIPYSEFKQHVVSREVVECEVKEDEIVGVIQVPYDSAEPSDAAKSKPADNVAPVLVAEPSAARPKTPANKNTKSSDQPTTEPSNKQPSPPTATNTKAPTTTKATTKKNSQAKVSDAKSPSKPTRFLFRTVRVEDPKLVDDLQAAGVRFEGVRPSFLQNLLIAWVIPLGLMFLLWSFLSRRLGAAGQAVMNIGKSQAKLVGEKQTGVDFEDVAGCDEAKIRVAGSR